MLEVLNHAIMPGIIPISRVWLKFMVCVVGISWSEILRPPRVGRARSGVRAFEGFRGLRPCSVVSCISIDRMDCAARLLLVSLVMHCGALHVAPTVNLRRQTGRAAAYGIRASLPFVTDSSFEELVIESQRPVLLAVGATWCGPCKMM